MLLDGGASTVLVLDNQSQAAMSVQVTAAAKRLAGRMSAHLLRWNAI
jgi:hypothetical protein